MTTSSGTRLRWSVAAAPVDGAAAAAMLRAYFTEIIARYPGRPVAAVEAAEVDAVLADFPSGGLAPPTGLFLLARYAGKPAGCVGLRLLTPRLGEVKRLFVRPDLRGLGGGSALLAAVERAGRDRGATALRLDTRHDLVEARRLYAALGYVEIPAYNDDPYAEHWFEKRLTGG
jgi:GNAT superfamily N-acetyltransferase